MSWRKFTAAREDLLRTLSPPILSAVGRHDTPSPIFHGCSDWHSAVHGLYSLYAIYQRTGDDLYLEAAEEQARPELVPRELEYMATVVAETENPYGFAWVVALVVRQELATGKHDLRPLAEHAAARMAELLQGLQEETAHALATTDKHRNLSFALIHLAVWARHAGDHELLRAAVEAAHRWLMTSRLDQALEVGGDTGDVPEFMAPALMRLAAISRLLGPDGVSYVRRRLPPRFTVRPLAAPRTVHAGGVNFFRAFALLHIAQALSIARLREDAARLVLYQVGRTDLWRSADYSHRHWVAQIGVRVIDDSYELEPTIEV